MKILQINCVYGHGSTGKITAQLHHALLAHSDESIVLYGRGQQPTDSGTFKICSEPYAKINRAYSWISGDRYGGCHLSTLHVIRRILAEAPDLVHLQCINGNCINIPALVRWLNRSGIPTVLTLHAEFMYTANCSHSFECERWRVGCGDCPRPKEATRSIAPDRTDRAFSKMQKAFTGFGDRLTVVSVSPWLSNRAKMSPILGNAQHTVVLNGVDESIFCPRNTDDLRKDLCLGESRVILHVTAMFSDDPTHAKGGSEVLAIAERFKNDDVRILVAGKAERIEKLPENVMLLGEIRDSDLMAQYYSLAGAVLITSKRETFSMPVAESLCCGTPVVGYEAGAPEQISLPEYSCFVPWGDTNALEAALRTQLTRPSNAAEIATSARTRYSLTAMTDHYFEIYRSKLCR